MGTPRMLLAFSIATIATVGVITALATGTWWLLPVALLGHVTGVLIAMRPVTKAVGEYDKPDPVEETRREEDEEEAEESADRREDTRGRMAI